MSTIFWIFKKVRLRITYFLVLWLLFHDYHGFFPHVETYINWLLSLRKSFSLCYNIWNVWHNACNFSNVCCFIEKLLIREVGTILARIKFYITIIFRGYTFLKAHIKLDITVAGNNILVRNAFIDNKWGMEERAGGFKFLPFTPFGLWIRRSSKKFSIWVNEKLQAEFAYRCNSDQVKAIHILGDVVISGVFINKQPEMYFWNLVIEYAVLNFIFVLYFFLLTNKVSKFALYSNI